MSIHSNGGEFATARRGGIEAVSYALALMAKGHTRASAARSAGCPIDLLPKSAWRTPPKIERPAPLRFVRSDDPPPGPASHHETIAIILRVVEPFGLSLNDVQSIRRTRKVAWPRQAAMAAVRKERPHLSLPQIGRIFNRDHTTVLHGIEQHEARMAWVEFLIWAAKPDEQPDLFARAA